MDRKKKNLRNFIGFGSGEDVFDEDEPNTDDMDADENDNGGLNYGNAGMGNSRMPSSDPIDINFGLNAAPAPQQAAPIYSNYNPAPAQPMSAPMNMAGGITMDTNPKEQQLMVVYPKDFREAGSIADHFLDRITVIVNMENADDNNKKRTIDFLSGVIYAARGQIKKVSNTTYVLTPESVDFINNEPNNGADAGKQY